MYVVRKKGNAEKSVENTVFVGVLAVDQVYNKKEMYVFWQCLMLFLGMSIFFGVKGTKWKGIAVNGVSSIMKTTSSNHSNEKFF